MRMTTPQNTGRNISAEETKKPEHDWWDGFKTAVEDPDISIYEYLRDSVLESIEPENYKGKGGILDKARKKTIQELFSLTNAEELSAKLKKLETNTLLFSIKTRVAIQLLRVVIDTYNSAGGINRKNRKNSAELESRLNKELANSGLDKNIEALARTFDKRDKEEVRNTVKEAARQLGNDDNLSKITSDIFRVVRKYMKPDTIAELAIIALPLITWQYRWALAVGLGVYAARMSIVHVTKAGIAGIRGNGEEARLQGQKTVAALKAAGGNILVVGCSPFLGRAPKLFAGAISFGVKASYKTVLDAFHDMLEKEEQQPGSTTLSKTIKRKLKKFFNENQDSLTSVSAGILQNLVPHTVTKTIVTVIQHLPMSKFRALLSRIKGLFVSVKNRFNKAAEGETPAAAQAFNEQTRRTLTKVSNDAAEIGTKIRDAVIDTVGDGTPDDMRNLYNKNRVAFYIPDSALHKVFGKQSRTEKAATLRTNKARNFTLLAGQIKYPSFG